MRSVVTPPSAPLFCVGAKIERQRAAGTMYRMPLVFLGIAASALIAGVGAASSQRASKAGVDAIFSDLTTPGSPGCALGVYRDGKIVYAHGYGLANIEENVPIT